MDDALEPDEWLSVGQAARMTNVCQATIRRWADQGKVDARLTPGGQRKISQRSLSQALAPAAKRGPRRSMPRVSPREAVAMWSEAMLDWDDWTPPGRLDDDDIFLMRQEVDDLVKGLGRLRERLSAELRERDERAAGDDHWRASGPGWRS